MAESVTLSIQTTCEQIASGRAEGLDLRSPVDHQLDGLERLISDRRAIIAGAAGGGVPQTVLERHGWLAVREARMNVRDAPEWWLAGRASAVALAADRGAAWLERLGVAGDDTLPQG